MALTDDQRDHLDGFLQRLLERNASGDLSTSTAIRDVERVIEAVAEGDWQEAVRFIAARRVSDFDEYDIQP
jgi:hypothetical protein